MCWAIWKLGNSACLDKKSIRSSLEVVHTKGGRLGSVCYSARLHLSSAKPLQYPMKPGHFTFNPITSNKNANHRSSVHLLHRIRILLGCICSYKLPGKRFCRLIFPPAFSPVVRGRHRVFLVASECHLPPL